MTPPPPAPRAQLGRHTTTVLSVVCCYSCAKAEEPECGCFRRHYDDVGALAHATSRAGPDGDVVAAIITALTEACDPACVNRTVLRFGGGDVEQLKHDYHGRDPPTGLLEVRR